MTLFKYFKREAKGEKGIHLPVENSPFPQVLPLIVIKDANETVEKTIKLQGKRNPLGIWQPLDISARSLPS